MSPSRHGGFLKNQEWPPPTPAGAGSPPPPPAPPDVFFIFTWLATTLGPGQSCTAQCRGGWSGARLAPSPDCRLIWRREEESHDRSASAWRLAYVCAHLSPCREQTFVCDGVGILHGRDPVCTAAELSEKLAAREPRGHLCKVRSPLAFCSLIVVYHGSVLGKVQCEEYNVEVGSLFMHGVWDEDS